ncbi:acyltransferase 3 [Flammeovirgaceae bacterium 311]|nr:acyltransferase 3 [Flammeovirgaceae bacterium 311]
MQKFFTLSANQNNRLAWMDYAKGIAIIMVVVRHVTKGMDLSGIVIDETVLEVIHHVGLTFRMPLFFLLSGIFFRMSIAKRSQTGYVLHKSKTILYPYLIWAFIITTLQLIMSGYVNANVDAWTYLSIIIAPASHWWFLVALFNVSVLYLVMYKIFRGQQLLLFAIGLIFYYLSPYLANISVVFHIFRLFIFFVAGDIISKAILNKDNYVKLASPRLLLLFILLAIAGEWVLFQETWRDQPTLLLLFAFTGSCAIIWTSYRLSIIKSGYLSVIRTIGQHSLYVYLLHSVVGAAIRILFVYGFGIDLFWVILPVSILFSLIMPIYLYRFCTNFGFWFLFSPETAVKQRVEAPVKQPSLNPIINS